MSKSPSATLLKKYKNAMIKGTLEEYGLNKEFKDKFGKEEYNKGVDAVKKDILSKKYDDRGLVYFVTKNYPNDKLYQEIKDNQTIIGKINNFFK